MCCFCCPIGLAKYSFNSILAIGGDEMQSGYVNKHLYLHGSKYFGGLTFNFFKVLKVL